MSLRTTWSSMLSRCYDSNNRAFKNYGGRSILVCDAWRADFRAFARDMGEKPDPNFSLDRIDNNAGYSPENCRWTDPKTQVRNSRVAKLSEKDVREILHAAHVDGLSIEDLILAYPVSWNQMRSVVLGKHFHLEDVDYPSRIPRRADAKQYRGGNSPKMTSESVLALRERYSAGEPTETLAIAFGISKSNAYTIASGRTWRKVK